MTTTIAYDAAKNRALSASGGATRTFTYDARGNVADNGPTGFVYDFANQPVTITGTGAAVHEYDGNLKRVKTVSGGKTVYTIYSRVTGGLIYRDEVTDNKTTDYASAGGAAVRLTKTAGGAAVPTYVHFDHLGSALAASSATGPILWRESYTPFGDATRTLGSAPANDNNTGFTGHLEDDAAGLIYMQARYYDPQVPRFLATDPIGYQDQLNLYAYVSNDPINKFDPTGLIEREIAREIFTLGSRLGQKVSITVEAGDLTQDQAENALSGVPDSFFANNNGQNLSGYAKPVTGGSPANRDRIGVQTQVAGRAIEQRGSASLQGAWRGISSFNITGRYYVSAVDGRPAGSVTADNPNGPGPVNLYNDYFGRSGVLQIQTLIHEAFHDTSPYSQRYNSLRDNCRSGYQIDCMGAADVHEEISAAAAGIINGN